MGQVCFFLFFLQRVCFRVCMVWVNCLMLLKMFWWICVLLLNWLKGGSFSILVFLMFCILWLVNFLSRVLSIVWVCLLYLLNMLCFLMLLVCLCWVSGFWLKVIWIIRLNIFSFLLLGMVCCRIFSGMLWFVSFFSIVCLCFVLFYWCRKLVKLLNFVCSVFLMLFLSRMWQFLVINLLLVFRYCECFIVMCIFMLLMMYLMWFLLLLFVVMFGGMIFLLGLFGLGDGELGLLVLGGILGGIIGLLFLGLQIVMGLLLKFGLVNRCVVFLKFMMVKYSFWQFLCRCVL